MAHDIPTVAGGKGYGRISWLFCALVFIAPFIYLSNVREYTDAPKEAFIQVGIVAICAAWILTERRRVKVPAAFIPALIFTTYAALTMFWAVNPYEGVTTSIHWSICSLAILIIANVVNKDHLLLAIFLSGFGIAVLGLMQKYGGLEVIPQSVAPAATMANAKHAAHYVTACFFLGLYINRWPTIAAALLMLFYVAITGSKLSLLVIVLTGLLTACFYLKKVWPVAVLVIIGIAVAPWATPSGGVRLHMYKAGLKIIANNPIGVGLQNAMIHHPVFVDKDKHGYNQTTKRGAAYIHSDLLQILVELGFAGFALLFLAVVAAGSGFDWSARRAPFVFASILALGVVSCFSYPMYQAAPPFLLACLVGLS